MILVWLLLPPIPKDVPGSALNQDSRSVRSLLNKDFGMTITLQGINRFCISGGLMSTLGLLVKDRITSPNMLIGAATITGLLIAGRTVVSMTVAPLVGHLSDRSGNRWRVMLFSLFLGCLAMLFLCLKSPIFILVGVLCGAVIASAVQSLTITLTGDLVDAAHRGKALSILHTVGDLGSAIGPPCAYAFLFHIGLNGMYLVCAGLFGLACVLVVLHKL
jgi:MFS family permease